MEKEGKKRWREGGKRGNREGREKVGKEDRIEGRG